MPYLRHLPFLAALTLGLAACGLGDAAAPVGPEPAAVPDAAEGLAPPPATAPETLGEGEVALAMMARHKLSATDVLTFVGVVDTRCPSDAECIRASEAHALFLMQSLANPDVLLTIPLNSASQVDPALRQRSAGGHRIHLLSLDPVPAEGVVVVNEDYVARLRIETDPAAQPGATDPAATRLEYDTPPAPAGPSPSGTREEFAGFEGWAKQTLGLHERVELSDTAALTLAGVIDSRCPAQAACATAGEAHVLFLVTDEGQPAQALALQWSAQSLHDPALRWKTAAGHRVYLESIDPRPESEAPTPAVSYRATLRIEGLAPPSGPAPGNIR